MKKLTLAAAVAIAALSLVSEASAGGWAGSRYDKSDCTYTKATNLLFCQTTFTESIENAVGTVYANDPTCVPSGTRVFQRTGTQVQTWVGFGTFTGHVPLAKNEIAGDEFPIGELAWQSFTDVDQGCFV